MHLTAAAVRAHAKLGHINPEHDFRGRQRMVLPTGQIIRARRNPSMWLPHQGAKECARRLRQQEGRANG